MLLLRSGRQRVRLCVVCGAGGKEKWSEFTKGWMVVGEGVIAF